MNLDQEKPTQEPNLSHEEECKGEPNYATGRKKAEGEDLKTFLIFFEGVKDPEEKIRAAIGFMQGRITAFASPKFREFWEVRKLCLPFFKEELSAKARAELWQQYVDLAVEARRVKEVLDERSGFAYEQIDLALQSLLSDLENAQEGISRIAPIDIPLSLSTLEAKRAGYVDAQKSLDFFNTLAAKLNSLRKEVIKTDMRVRSKNKLFEKLSSCGDRIFPQRKQLIKQVSEDFIEDVTRFFGGNFQDKKPHSGSLFSLREEVKGLQSIAKILTLNTYAFTETRLKLSSCWDLLREWEKEKKKEMLEKKSEFQRNFDEFSLKVDEFSLFCGQTTSLDEVESKHSELLRALREVELSRFESKLLKDRMEAAKKPHQDRRALELAEMRDKEKLAEIARAEKVETLRLALEEKITSSIDSSADDLEAQRNEFEESYKRISCSKSEKVLFDRLFKQLKDKMSDAKRNRLLHMSSGQRDQYESLAEILEEMKERKAEIRVQLETYRKAIGGSALDFEKSMATQELIETEKESLEKISSAIKEIEEKIAQIKG